MPTYALSYEHGQFTVHCRYSDGIPFSVFASGDLMLCIDYIARVTGGPVVLEILHKR